MLAQTVHAAGESVAGPVPPGTHAVVLAAKDEAELHCLSTRLSAADVPHVLITEPDPPFNGQATALGIQPMERERLRPFLRSYSLLKEAT
jgi:hypothetical protein